MLCGRFPLRLDYAPQHGRMRVAVGFTPRCRAPLYSRRGAAFEISDRRNIQPSLRDGLNTHSVPGVETPGYPRQPAAANLLHRSKILVDWEAQRGMPCSQHTSHRDRFFREKLAAS